MLQNHNKGFIVLFPLLCMMCVTLSGAYLLIYKTEVLSYSAARKEQFFKEKYEVISCTNQDLLNVSLDPDYVSNC
jgi:hypothetical protein